MSRSSPAASDISELSMLSRSPSPPPELEFLSCRDIRPTASSSRSVRKRLRGTDGRFASPQGIRGASPGPERPSKRYKRKSRFLNSAKSVVVCGKEAGRKLNIALPVVNHNDGPCGTLSLLPMEIRQMIYQIVLDRQKPITAKACCGPIATKRERTLCKKHGNQPADTGRFNILLVSKQVKEEASYILYNQCKLRLFLDQSTSPYLAGYCSKTLHRLGNIPNSEQLHAMWNAVAKYQFVDIEIPRSVLQNTHPTVFMAHLGVTASMLFKAWESRAGQPTVSVSHSVTIHLGTLFNETIPFNAIRPDMDQEVDKLVWIYRNHLLLHEDFQRIYDESWQNLKKTIAIIGQHKGETKWNIAALSQLDKNCPDGASLMKALKNLCGEAGIRFEGKTRKELGYE